MALNYVTLSAGDRGNWVARSSSPAGLGPSASALAMVAGDGFLVGRPEPGHGPRRAVRLGAPSEGRRVPGGPTRLQKGRKVKGGSRVRPPRFAPYPIPRARPVC
ncbi:uncharacterized protein C11orf71 homolog [Octodon degus]|uniref:Uncharacterized protein C11orf71 homolog n=1 Tax=Octodon degus TaxID=10160 RepID=A0A6P3FFE2_OCTDE|nr:uncharacterized protein C11orf71 homolog [Octodon degus]